MFTASADGNVAPNTVIAGPTTKLNGAQSIALDQQGNIYLGAGDSTSSAGVVLVFAAGASDDIAPARTIRGPNTSLGKIIDLHVAANGTLYLSAANRIDFKTHILTFAADADGHARPLTDLYPAAPAEKSVSVDFGSFAVL